MPRALTHQEFLNYYRCVADLEGLRVADAGRAKEMVRLYIDALRRGQVELANERRY
jgi:hypothetical protein